MRFSLTEKAFSFMFAFFMVAALVVTVPAVSASGDDPTPENVGVLWTDSKTGIEVSNAVLIEEGGQAITAVSGLGSHGGHETRLCRTEYGTYVTYITDHVQVDPSDTEHANWGNGIATFKIMKITSEGSHVIFSAIYPKANGSCTPNILNAGDGKLYVTILCEDPDRYYQTMGTSEFTNAAWVMLYEIDAANGDNVELVASAKYDYPTTPFQDHGYGYSQPILDKEHGKLYALYCGGEVPGYLAWFTFDLNSRRWESGCHFVELPARYCYINGYPDGKGGFSLVIERDAPSSEYGAAYGMTFAGNGYLFDAEYMIHVPDPTVDHADVTTIWEPSYATGGKNLNASASHYGVGGCTYLDAKNELHVIYSVTYYTTPTSKTTKVSGVYHAIYDLDGNELYNELIPTTLLSNNGTKTYKGPRGFVMTQAWDGTYYVFLLSDTSTATLEIWSSPADDGINFTKVKTSLVLKDASGNSIEQGTMPIIANSRNFSTRDGVAAFIFHSTNTINNGNPYYYVSVKLDEPVPHDHVWVDTVTAPTCTEQGFTTHVCSVCGQKTTDSYVDPLGHAYVAVVTSPTCTEEGYTTNTCSRCGDTFVAGGTDPLGHSYVPVVTEPTCTEEGYTTNTCSRCGDTFVAGGTDPLGHLWDEGVTTLEPTATEDGIKTFTCTRCEATMTETIPATGPTYVPGDINGDGIVNSKDLTRLLKYVSGVDVEVNEAALDVNGDGVVNSKDLTRLLKYVSGVDVEIF